MEAVRRCVLGSPEFPFVLKSYKKQKKIQLEKKGSKLFDQQKYLNKKAGILLYYSSKLNITVGMKY